MVADGAVPPIDKSCGEGLMPDGVEALRALGIAVPVSEAYPFRGIRFVNEGVTAEARFPRGTAYGIRRTHLHRVMTEHAEACGVHLLWRTAVSGLESGGVRVAGEMVQARWIVGADGTGSRVRRWAGLDREVGASLFTSSSKWFGKSPGRNPRFAFRRHYQVRPWTDFMELHWGRNCQIYVTPVSGEEVCVALVSSSPQLRLDDALGEFPELSAHLGNAGYSSRERGAITVTRRLRRVYRDRTSLVGDASGGVDAITGEGLCLTFRQAAVLAACLADGNLARYQKEHSALGRRPAAMAGMMLFLAKHVRLRRRAMRVFESNPRSFAGMLALHVGEGSAREHVANGIALGWELLTG